MAPAAFDGEAGRFGRRQRGGDMGGAGSAKNLSWRIPPKKDAIAGVATPLRRYGDGRGLREQARSIWLLTDEGSSIGAGMFTD